MKEKFQSFGKAMLVPITLIAISGLFLGIGSVFTTELTLVSLGVNWDWYAASPLFTFFSVFKGLGEVIIGNLGVLFAVGCAFSLSRKEKGWAAFSALVCYLTMLKTVEILLGAAGLAADNTTVEALQKVGLTSIQASEQSALYTTSLGFLATALVSLAALSWAAWSPGSPAVFTRPSFQRRWRFLRAVERSPLYRWSPVASWAASCTSFGPSSVDASRVLRRS